MLLNILAKSLVLKCIPASYIDEINWSILILLWFKSGYLLVLIVVGLRGLWLWFKWRVENSYVNIYGVNWLDYFVYIESIKKSSTWIRNCD